MSTFNTDDSIQMDTKLVRDNRIIFSDMDGETVMMNIERGEYYGINPIGSRIWDLLDTPKTPSQICDTLQPDYDVSRQQCETDVLSFLNQMIEKGIVQKVKEG